jgi:hypothetical protein
VRRNLDFSSDLKTTSEAFVTAQSSETDGTNEYDSGDYIAAEMKFEDAENYYADARSEILNLKTEYDRQVAEAGINSVVEEFFTSIRDGDFATFNSILHLNGDAAENWRELLKQYVRLENQSHEIQLQNDNSTATVQLSALYHYRARGQDGDFPINQTWEVQLTDGKWIVENVQHK